MVFRLKGLVVSAPHLFGRYPALVCVFVLPDYSSCMQVFWDSNMEPFVGSTPTAPFAKLALHLGKNDVVSGVKVWSTTLPVVRVSTKVCVNGSSHRAMVCNTTQPPQTSSGVRDY